MQLPDTAIFDIRYCVDSEPNSQSSANRARDECDARSILVEPVLTPDPHSDQFGLQLLDLRHPFRKILETEGIDAFLNNWDMANTGNIWSAERPPTTNLVTIALMFHECWVYLDYPDDKCEAFLQALPDATLPETTIIISPNPIKWEAPGFRKADPTGTGDYLFCPEGAPRLRGKTKSSPNGSQIPTVGFGLTSEYDIKIITLT